MGLMLSVLVMCVGVLEAISSVQHIRESFLPLEITRKKRRMVVDLGTGNVRHADISWPGDIPKGSHVIKKRSGLTSPHSSFDVPDDDHVSRRCSEHFDSAQLERAVSAILLEEDNSSDETSEEVTQILSRVVHSRIEFATEQSRVPEKPISSPEPSHDTFAPINEPRHDAERVPGKQPLLASEAVEADIVDLKPNERLIKYPSAETGLDEYDSSESSEKYVSEKRSVSKSDTSVSYGSELPSSSLSSEILVDEERRSKPFDVLGVSCNEVTDTPVKVEMIMVADEPDSNETISELIESTNNVLLSENIVTLCPQRQLSVPKTTLPEDENHIGSQVSILRNDVEHSELNENENFPHQESIVELIESTNNMLFSEDRPKLQHSDSIVELIQSTNSLVFVPESVSQSQGNDGVEALVERQESIEELIKSTNNVILSQEVVEGQDLMSPDNTVFEIECAEQSLDYRGEVLNEFLEQDVTINDPICAQLEERIASSKTLVLAEGKRGRNSPIHHSSNESLHVSAEYSSEAVCEGSCGTKSAISVSDSSSVMVPEVAEINLEPVEISERVSSLSNKKEHSSVPLVKPAETCANKETNAVPLGSSSNEQLDTLSSIDDFDRMESKTVTHPMQNLSSSDEDDSAYSVSTIVKECVQAIVDIEPPGGEKESKGELTSDHNTDGMSRTKNAINLTQAGKVIISIPNKIEAVEHLEAPIHDENSDEKDKIEVLNERKNHDLSMKTEDRTPDGHFSDSAGVDELHVTAENLANHNASSLKSPRDNDEPNIDISVLPSPKVEETFIFETPVHLEEQLVQKGDSALDSMDQISIHPNEMTLPKQQDGVILKDESKMPNDQFKQESDVVDEKSTLRKQVDDATVTEHKEPGLDEGNMDSMKNGVSQFEITGSEKVESEVVEDVCSVAEEPKSLHHDTITVRNEEKTETEFGLKEQDEQKPVVLKSEHIAVTTRNVEYDTHKLVESVTKNEDTKSASYVDSGASHLTVQENFGETEVVDEEVKSRGSAHSSQGPQISNVPNQQLQDSLEFDSSDDVLQKPAERVTQNENLEPTSEAARRKSALTSSETEVADDERVLSEHVQSIDEGPQVSKAQYHRHRDSREVEINSGEDDDHKPAERASKTENVDSTSVFETGKSAIISSETEVAEDERVIVEEFKSSPQISEVPNQQHQYSKEREFNSGEDGTYEPDTGASKTENTDSASVVAENTDSALTSSETNIAGEERVVREEVRPKDSESGSSSMDLLTSKKSSSQLVDSKPDTDSQSVSIDSSNKVVGMGGKTNFKGDGRSTNEIATDPRTSACEVQQEVRRVSSIDEGEVINVKPRQNRPTEMENVQDAPSSSPNKAFWVRD